MTIKERWQEIKAKIKERDEVLEQLDRSFAIQDLLGDEQEIAWPVTTEVAGMWDSWYLLVKQSNGVVNRFELDQIPEELQKAPHIKKALDHIKQLTRQRGAWRRRRSKCDGVQRPQS